MILESLGKCIEMSWEVLRGIEILGCLEILGCIGKCIGKYREVSRGWGGGLF